MGPEDTPVPASYGQRGSPGWLLPTSLPAPPGGRVSLHRRRLPACLQETRGVRILDDGFVLPPPQRHGCPDAQTKIQLQGPLFVRQKQENLFL